MSWHKKASKHIRSLLIIVSLALLVFAPMMSVFVGSAPYAAAQSSSLNQSTDINDLTSSIKYFYMLKYCANADAFKTNIYGGQAPGDIQNGPWTWFHDKNVELGIIFDQWGDKNGITNCYGESKDGSGWFTAAMKLFGVDMSNKQNALEALGYACNLQSDNNIHCINNDANKPESSPNSVLGKLMAMPYLKGAASILSTSSAAFGAASYNAALTAFAGNPVDGSNNLCKGTQGGYVNIVQVNIVGTDGTIKSTPYSYTDTSSIWHSGALDLTDGDADTWNTYKNGSFVTLDTTTNPTDCRALTNIINKNATSYQQWMAETVCSTSYGVTMYTQESSACASGWLNKTNYAYCVNTFTARSSIMEACFNGQGLPQDSGGQTSGILCYNDPKNNGDANLIAACIKGSINKSDPSYCSNTYPMPDNLSGANSNGTVDKNAPQRTACQRGAQLPVGSVRTATAPKPQGALGGGACTPDSTDPNCKQPATTCAVSGVGWIVCPVMTFLGGLGDKAFTFLQENFLQTDPGIVTQGTNGGDVTYTAWNDMRSFANVAFVIAFLFIIFSQLTGVGVSNYGVKKMLPRLVIAAVLVNISFYVCALAVDISNILGGSLKSLFDNFANSLTVNGAPAGNQGWGWATLIAGLLVGGISLAFAISVPVLLAALLAVLMIALTLAGRTALIVILIIISPLAFVAYILPNTEQWFKKWTKLFSSLLILYPTIGVVFGASQLAAKIIYASAASTNTELLGVMAIAISALPLFVVPSMLKGALKGAGAIGAKIQGWNNKAGGRVGSKVKDTSRLGDFRKYRQNLNRRRRAEINAGAFTGSNRNPLNWGRNASSRLNRAFNSGPLSGKFGDQASAAAGEMEAADIKAAEQQFATQNLSPQALREQFVAAVKAKDGIRARAAQNMLLKTAPGREEFHNAVEGNAEKGIAATELGSMESVLRTNVNNNHPDMKGKDVSIARWGYDQSAGLSGHQTDGSTYGSLSDAEMAGQRLQNMQRAAATGSLNAAMASRILNNPSLNQGLNAEQRAFLGGISESQSPKPQEPIQFTQDMPGDANGNGASKMVVPADKVLSQISGAGGWAKLSDKDVMDAYKHATQTLSGANNNPTNQLGSEAIDELRRRGIFPQADGSAGGGGFNVPH